MATLYTHADSNIRKTWLFMSLFFVFIIGIGWMFSYALRSPILLPVAVGIALVMNFFSYWYSDKIVLAMTRAKSASREEYTELYRIIENLSITAGLPMPRVYVVEEAAPNAFATGRNPQHAVVAVTRGLLLRLERAELEGVLAHELSHIGNRDMLISTLVVVMVGFVAILSDFSLRISFHGGFGDRRDSRGGQAHAILLVLAIVAAILAPIVATLIRLAISRRREFLADASGALLTRYPEGLARALRKIAQDPTPLRAASNATAHLYFENPFKGERRASWFTRLFLTHPPVEERIAALLQK